MTRVLCVDDEPSLLTVLDANLRARGIDTDLAATGERAIELASIRCPDLVVLDLGLPKLSGIEVIRSLRTWTQTPIIVLSARDSEEDKIEALDAGADDYVAKPFGMGELLARVRAALRRAGSDDDVVVATPHFVLDLASKRATRPDGAPIRLTPTEWHLIEALVRNEGRLMPGRTLLQTVWGPQYGSETNYLRVHMAHVRRKLEPVPGSPRYFHTEPGLGYRFESSSIDAPAR
jgi:two-component system, OmpR family, KDP operon response regulator KdpE